MAEEWYTEEWRLTNRLECLRHHEAKREGHDAPQQQPQERGQETYEPSTPHGQPHHGHERKRGGGDMQAARFADQHESP
jgi:hypothetical protein